VIWLVWGLVLVGFIVLKLVWFTANTAARVERVLPPQGSFVDVAGSRIHYVERGRGPITLLMIHGLGGNAGNFLHSLVDQLAADFRVVVMDRPGSGYSTRANDAPAGPYAQADVVAAFIQALGLDRPVLVGHSLGGAISLAAAIAHPSLVRSLALVAPLTALQVGTPGVFRPLMIEHSAVRRAIAWTLATPFSMTRLSRVLHAIFSPDPVPADFSLAGGGMLSLRPSAFIAASTDFMAARREFAPVVAQYDALRVPVGIIYGTEDRILDYRVHGEGMRARVPHLDLELVEGAGHMIPITTPERVAAFVRRIALQDSQ
jgi:pimeloyl-ACP methyl ester carboxylesterase